MKILKRWKKHKLSVALIIIGYIVGILAISIGISITNNAKEYSLEMTHGNVKNQRQINISNKSKNESLDCYSLINKICENNNDLELQIMGITEPFDNNNVLNPNLKIYPTFYCSKPKWQMSLLQGRYLTPKETQSEMNIAVVGKKVAQKYFSNKLNNDSTVNVSGKSYKVVGVMGNIHRDSPTDIEVIIPIKSLDLISENTISIVAFGDKNIDDNLNKLNGKLTSDDKSLNIKVDNVSEDQDASIMVTTAGASLVAFLILFTTVANVSNLSYFWILSRKNEIAIKKALGAAKEIVMYDVITEVVLMALLGAVIALLIQIIAEPFLTNLIKNVELTLQWNNFIFGIGVSFICGLISSMTPVREALKIQPAEALKAE